MAVRLVPQSLFGRLLLALLAVVGVTLVVVVALIVRERRDLALLGTGAWSTAEVIADTSVSLSRQSPEERAATVGKFLVESISTEDSARPRPPPRRQDAAVVAKTYANRIRRELGSRYAVQVTPATPRAGPVIRVGMEPRRTEPPPETRDARFGEFQGPPGGPGPGPGFGPGQGDNSRLANFLSARFLDVSVTLPDGESLVFRTVAPQPGPPLPSQIFTELGILTIILAFVLYFMTRSITRPLSDLAGAAESVGRGARHAPLAERGAREVRDATRAFNTMQERLQRYLDSRTRVLAAMSHDLRTPLTRLRLRAELIDNADLRGRFTADLDEMNGMVKGALSLFRDLNDDETLEPVDINALLRQLQSEFAETAGEVSIEGATATPLLAKPKALKRCLANLLHNAIKYGTRAHVFVTDGPEVVIRIQDEGQGIPEEFLQQVFEPFFRVESSRNRDTGGTGLGLCIARDVAQSHGGTIQLQNPPGAGLEAALILPRTTTSRK